MCGCGSPPCPQNKKISWAQDRMPMIAVIDTNLFIHGRLGDYQYDAGYITSQVLAEIKDVGSRSLAALYSYKIEVRDPQPETVEEVSEEVATRGLQLSGADMSLVALCVELQSRDIGAWIGPERPHESPRIVCLTEDSRLLQALAAFGIGTNRTVQERTYKVRCHVCYTIYDNYADFCRRCGYHSLRYVSVTESEGGIRLHLKKSFKIVPKELRSPCGVVIRSADQKEYRALKKKQRRKELRSGKASVDSGRRC